MRVLVRSAAWFALLILMPLSMSAQQADSSGWERLPAILARIVPPVFQQRTFDVTEYGAKGDGKKDCTAAFRKAIERCNASGGGIVLVPKGVFLCGPIHLKSNVNLHLSKDALIKFSTDPKQYLPVVFTRWEGVECMNYSPLIYAYRQENIAVTGEGTLDGQGSDSNWWAWKGRGGKDYSGPTQAEGRKRLFEMGEKGVPVEQRVFGDGFFLRPSFFVPYECTNVLVQGVTFKDSPMWFLNPVLCRNISIIGVTTEGQGPNNDGCDPESCTDVLINDCKFDNGDDCIAIKSGRNNDGRRVNVPSANIVVQGCTMKNGHGGVVIGSEISGGVRNVYAEDCAMDSPVLDRVLRIKTNAVRGGIIENVFMRNIKVGEIAEAVVKIDFYYEEAENGPFLPVVRNVNVSNVDCRKSGFGIWIRAFGHSPASDIRIEHCTFRNAAKPDVIENVKNLTLIDVTRGR